MVLGAGGQRHGRDETGHRDRVVLQAGAHAGQVRPHRQAQRAELSGRAETGPQQQRRVPTAPAVTMTPAVARARAG